MDIEDSLVPYLRLDSWEKSLYYHLLRYTRVIGKRSAHVSHRGLVRTSGISITSILSRLRGLERKGCIRTLTRGYRGKDIEVFLPGEIAGCLPGAPRDASRELEAANCMKNPELRQAIYRREGGRCFYCLRRLLPKLVSLDHVISLAEGGDHSYRNVVVCCFECNVNKSSTPAIDFLRGLWRKGRINKREWKGRIRALRDLQAGRLKPLLRAA
ncbi:MAG TPA: HNH endonuclease signature motif containing protein [Candidatus Nitrosotenuis sp.]|nr:HNH endonuclease signature motif containing protein [Candidatus Nitrosotenuis sp.]